MQSKNRLVIATIVCCCLAPSLRADDWPQWMGPQRDGVYRESGTVESIPDEGLPVVWTAEVATGYSGPAVADGRVFVSDYVIESGESTNNPGGQDKLTGRERVLCFDEKSGEQLWMVEYERPYELSFPNGPRATPTVDGDRVYVLGAEGDLLCLKVDSGDILWRKELNETYETETPIWGHAAHPLVHGDLLYCLAGGEGSVVVALDKMSGDEVWSALSASEIGYCPPMIYELGGVERLLVWHADGLNALDPTTGQVDWTYDIKPRYGMAIAAPRLAGDLLFATGIGETAAMIRLDSDGWPSDTLWTGKPKMGIYAGNATPLIHEGVIYGADCGTGEYIAVDVETGEQHWTTFKLTTGGERRASHGTAFTVRQADRFWLFMETGQLVLARFSQSGFEELGRMQVLEPTGECFGRDVVWSHPAFANGHIFARNDQQLVCVNLQNENESE